MSDDDPLDGADIGETVTVTETHEIWVGGLQGDACRGSDRMADSNVRDVTLRTDEYGEQYLDVTLDSEVTKRLPRCWDHAQEPRTDSERRQARRRKWGRRIARFGAVPVVLAIALGITHHVMRDLSGEVVFGGEPLSYSFWSLTPVVVLVVLVTALVFAIPHMLGGMGRGSL